MEEEGLHCKSEPSSKYSILIGPQRISYLALFPLFLPFNCDWIVHVAVESIHFFVSSGGQKGPIDMHHAMMPDHFQRKMVEARCSIRRIHRTTSKGATQQYRQ